MSPTLPPWVAFISRTSISRAKLENELKANTTLSNDRKNQQLTALGRTESSFLRLRRTKIGLEDFRTVKVIGKGAFGEVGKRIHRFRHSN